MAVTLLAASDLRASDEGRLVNRGAGWLRAHAALLQFQRTLSGAFRGGQRQGVGAMGPALSVLALSEVVVPVGRR